VSDCVVALDLGGTMLKAGLVDAAGRTLLARHRPAGRERGPDAGLAGVLDAADELAAAAREDGHVPVAIGLVVPGIIDEARGVAVFSANFGWRDTPLRELLERRSGLPVAFGHDVRAGGLAEGTLGAARGAGDFLFLALGTGIAGAAVLDGRPYAGGGYGGEIGHVVVEPGGRRCGCGGRGCLETVASASAIAARACERSGETGLSAIEVAERAARGDPVASAVWGEAVEALAMALAMYVSVLAPELIVLGGGLAEAGTRLLEPLDAALGARLTFHRRPRLCRAALGDQAGRLGAALLAWQRVGHDAPASAGAATS
jgi:glucokinase